MLVKNELKKLQTFDSSYFKSRRHFEEDGTQNYLVFQPMWKYLKKMCNTNNISERRSKSFHDEFIKPFASSNNSVAPTLIYFGNKIRVKSDASCLKQDKIAYIHGKIVNMYIVYELKSSYNYSDHTLENCLFC